MTFLAPLAIFFLFFLIIITKSHVRVPLDKRVAVFRLGKFLRILRPGLHFVSPVIDLRKSVDLNEKVPGWRGMTPEKIDERVKEIVLYEP